MTNVVLRRLTERDSKDIWLWRNHPEVRKNFFNTEPVPWREHKKWFTSKIKDPETKIYIAMCGKHKIGVIRFEIENDVVRISINLNPDFLGKGLGSKVIRQGTEKFYKETKSKKPIIAEIKKDNIAIQKALDRAGYSFREERGEKYEIWQG